MTNVPESQPADPKLISSTAVSAILMGQSLLAWSTLFAVAWIISLFFHPLALLGYVALFFNGLMVIQRTVKSLIDHHAAINFLLPLELQLAAEEASRQKGPSLKPVVTPPQSRSSTPVGVTGKALS